MTKTESARVFSSISHANLQRIDAMAKEQNCSRSALLADAVDAFLNGNGHASSAELMQLRMKVEHYEDTIKQDQQQILFLQSQIAQLIQNLSQLALPKANEEEKEKRKHHWWKFW